MFLKKQKKLIRKNKMATTSAIKKKETDKKIVTTTNIKNITIKQSDKKKKSMLSGKFVSKEVLKKPGRITIELKTNKPVPDVLSEPNIYFKSVYKKEKENLYFK